MTSATETRQNYSVDTATREKLGRVAVLMGGDSAERPISLKSGRAVCDALVGAGVQATAVDVQGHDLLRLASSGDFDRAFIALHGRGGEDGTAQAILQQAGIPYTGSGVMASALGMDKLRTKYVFVGAGLPTPAFSLMSDASQAASLLQELGSPLGVKPAREGSSIGIYKVNSEAELVEAFYAAAAHDPMVLVERWIDGPEFTVAVLGDRALPAIGLATDHVFYDFEAKYESNDTLYRIPCGLDQAGEETLKQLSLAAFRELDCHGWGRVDLMQDAEGAFWLLEINTVPGMTDHSLVPMAARAEGIGFAELVVRILLDAPEVRS
ncbi:MAG: D-alanine--D-alanine ligase [Halomonadaceae bacterium]|nr:MAG: D-alanine--D-alanine ligase [Halomonadaceae bacterium]